MQCPRCHNSNVKQFYQLNGQYYCRKCIQFHRVMIEEPRNTYTSKYTHLSSGYSLDFELSPMQKQISKQLVQNYQQHKSSLVLAVCGSGKTEIVYEVIQFALSQGQRVCFCVPRKELVKELSLRIQKNFYGVEIGILYGGYTKNMQAQFIICTTHQLYKFENSYGFDLIVADEVDAFPFYGNLVLQEIFNRCCLGNYIKLSATLLHDDIKDEEVLIMNRRYHNYDLPIPQVIMCPQSLQIVMLKCLLYFIKKKLIVYVPTVSLVDKIVKNVNSIRRTKGVSSKHISNQQTIQELKDGNIDVIVSTTLLERGITIDDVQVIVYQSEHELFDQRTLTQIAGRVGRTPKHPKGKVYFLTSERTYAISQCIKNIKKLNQMNALSV